MFLVERREPRRSDVFETGTILEIQAGDDRERELLEEAGHQVITCPGPAAGACPLVEHGSCSMVDAADGVVFRLDLDDPYNRRILRCYRSELGDATPLHVVAPADRRERHAALLEGLPATAGGLRSALDGFSAQVAMAAAARSVLSELADPTRRSSQARPA